MTCKNNIVFFGFKSSGKSYFAQKLSIALNRVWIDTDCHVEKRYYAFYGKTLSSKEIVLTIGEKGFRQLEKEVVSTLSSQENTVISLGGGTLLDPENQKTLLPLGRFIYLDPDKTQLKQRILQGSFPSFLDPDDFEHSFERVYEERKRLYESIPSYRIPLQGKTDEEILNEILSIL